MTDPSTFTPHGTFKLGIRSFQEGDEGVVFDPWRRQLSSIPGRDLHPRIFKMTAAELNAHMDDVVRPLVLSCPPMVACEVDHPTQVFGWVCCEHQEDRQVLHFLYVRNMWRQKGVASQLLRHNFPALGKEPLYCTHPTRMMRHHEDRWCLKFNPYLTR